MYLGALPPLMRTPVRAPLRFGVVPARVRTEEVRPRELRGELPATMGEELRRAAADVRRTSGVRIDKLWSLPAAAVEAKAKSDELAGPERPVVDRLA